MMVQTSAICEAMVQRSVICEVMVQRSAICEAMVAEHPMEVTNLTITDVPIIRLISVASKLYRPIMRLDIGIL